MKPKKALKKWPELRQREMLLVRCLDSSHGCRCGGSAKAKVESELARVQNALVVVEEARWKAEGRRRRTRLAVWPTNKFLCF